MLVLAIGSPAANPAAPTYVRTSVAEILAQPQRFDGKRVEVHGKILLDQENSTFSDGSRCARAKVCALWAEFPDCAVVRDGDAPLPCRAYIEKLVELKGEALNPQPIEIDGATARGVVATSSKDVKYARSVPKRDRVGRFGHLGAYGAQINVQQIGIPVPAK